MNKLDIAKYFRYKRQDRFTWVKDFDKALSKTAVEIPARAGSSRFKDKNVHEVCGLPLLAYTILLAKQLRNVDRVIVNTDSPRYAALARDFGAEAPFLRPDEFADSKCPPTFATYYLKRYLMDEGYPLKKLVTLLPTSPFRNRRVIEAIIDKLDYVPYVCSGVYTDTDLRHTILREPGDGLFAPHPLPDVDGFSFFKTMGMISGFNFLPGKGKKTYVHVINSPIEMIDIDNSDDFRAMETIVENRQYDFGCSICQ